MSRKNLAHFAAALLILETAGIVWLWLGHPPQWFRANFYSLSWWPFLILIETAAQLRWGSSLLYSRPLDFARLCILSIPFLIREAIVV